MKHRSGSIMAVVASISLTALADSESRLVPEQTLSLERAVSIAIENDPWLTQSVLNQKATVARSVAAGTLADPKVSLKLSNLAIDSLQFDQEPMTQMQLGISQTLPRGDSLSIRKNQLLKKSAEYPILREDRKAKLKKVVSEQWLDSYAAQFTIELIEKDWHLFEQLTDITKSSYSSAIGKTRQHDIIRAQLEILQLEDRLTREKQNFEISNEKLNEWMFSKEIENYGRILRPGTQIDSQLPNTELSRSTLTKLKNASQQELASLLSAHPLLAAIDVKQSVFNQSIKLAEQLYKPKWTLNASYGYRDNAQDGRDRSDLFSVGISMDVPLFTRNKQDKTLSAATADAEAIKAERYLIHKSLISSLRKELRNLTRLSERQRLYKESLLMKSRDQAQASLTAYTNDDGDFSEVVRARIAELNTRISALKIDVDLLKTVSRINYYLSQSSYSQNTNKTQEKGAL